MQEILSVLSYRDLNFFNEDISCACIDADLVNTSWDMLLTDAETDEMDKIINICLEICKKHVLLKKNPKKHQIPRDRRVWWEKDKNWKRKYRCQQIIKPKKMHKNQIKEIGNNLKISINTERNYEKRELLLLSKITPNTSTYS